MRLLLAHPLVAARSCEDCARWVYLDDGRQQLRLGLPVLRPKGTPTPCWKCPKVPEDAPAKVREHAEELSDQNWLAYRHYLECRAVGRFPDDPIVRRQASLVRQVTEGWERGSLAARLDAILTTLGVLTRG